MDPREKRVLLCTDSHGRHLHRSIEKANVGLPKCWIRLYNEFEPILCGKL